MLPSYRVMGILAVSRAIGDMHLKTVRSLCLFSNILIRRADTYSLPLECIQSHLFFEL